MPHIHTDADQHDLTVTAYILRVDAPEPKALLHMHKKLNVLLPVGGHVELSETPWQAVAHELEEESGYALGQLKVLQPQSRIRKMPKTVLHPMPLSMNTHSIPKSHFHTDIEYAFVAYTGPALKIAEGESLDVRWVSQEELNNLDSTEIYENTKVAYNFMFDEALENWDTVSSDAYLLKFPEEYR